MSLILHNTESLEKKRVKTNYKIRWYWTTIKTIVQYWTHSSVLLQTTGFRLVTLHNFTALQHTEVNIFWMETKKLYVIYIIKCSVNFVHTKIMLLHSVCEVLQTTTWYSDPRLWWNWTFLLTELFKLLAHVSWIILWHRHRYYYWFTTSFRTVLWLSGFVLQIWWCSKIPERCHFWLDRSIG